ncbi:MAG: WbqC family protein [Pyrinomonadaceae bacterium]
MFRVDEANRVIVSIHQPHFLPWIGYFNKVLQSDAFVWLNHVQYRKNYYQNRTRVKNAAEEPFWLTLPVHAKHDTMIDKVIIADPRWRVRITKTVEQCYRKAPHFLDCWPPLSAAIMGASDSLDQANYQIFLALMHLLEANHVRVIRAEEIPVTSSDPTGRLVETCHYLGASRYIAGRGGHNYLRAEEFAKEGIDLIWQEFDSSRVVYPQLGARFVPGLSVIDCIFNLGPAKAKELIQGAWTQ